MGLSDLGWHAQGDDKRQPSLFARANLADSGAEGGNGGRQCYPNREQFAVRRRAGGLLSGVRKLRCLHLPRQPCQCLVQPHIRVACGLVAVLGLPFLHCASVIIETMGVSPYSLLASGATPARRWRW
jgi:hypothetical protein